MASLIPGYEYDIFISYRQKDNKGDRWVSEFVNALRTELESTFKEDISVYFDINPHDGLLETHDVNASLKDKLKCLVFIPIISRTYCDPKSFAWENEFKAFINLAYNDQSGIKVKLPNGNVANRVLPVQIHDLYPEDKATVEKELGGVLRAIEFIYKEPGVNKPLTAGDDDKKNLNNTKYRIQINKVANAIDEIIHGLRSIQIDPAGRDLKRDQKVTIVKEGSEVEIQKGKTISNKKINRWLMAGLLAIFCIMGIFVVLRVIERTRQTNDITKLDKSIAVLPFVNDSPDKENEYFCNGMMEEILNQLQKIGDLKVKARTSVEKYRNTNQNITEIGKELKVSLIMEGSVRKVGNDLRIATQLIDTKTGDHLWSEIYDGKYTTEIFGFQSSVAKKVASSLNVVITPQENLSINAKPTTDIKAYDLMSRGGEMVRKYRYSNDSSDIKLAFNLLDEALKIHPDFILALQQKASAFNELGIYDSALYYHRKANRIDPEHLTSLAGLGVTYMYSNQPDSAFKYLQMAVEQNPNETWGNLALGQIYMIYIQDAVKSLFFMKKAYDLAGDSESEICRNLAMGYYWIGENEKAVKYFEESLRLRSEFIFVIWHNLILAEDKKFIEANNFLDSTCRINAFGPKCDILRFYLSVIQKDFVAAENYYLKADKEGYRITEDDAVYLAYLYKETGRKEKAFAILNNLIPADLELLKKGPFVWSWRMIKSRLAASQAVLGNSERSLEYLKEVGNSGCLTFPFSVTTFSGFDNLHNNPEFKAIVKRIKDEKDSLGIQVKEMERQGEIEL